MKRQRTLFDCISQEEGTSKRMNYDQDDCDGHVDPDEDDCDNHETQHNAISVYQPCGPTTIFVNSLRCIKDCPGV